MPTIAIYSRDADQRRRLDRLVRANQPFKIAGDAADAPAVEELLVRQPIDVVIVDAPPHDMLSDWVGRFGKTVFLVMTSEDDDELDALAAGAYAVLPRSAGEAEIAAALVAAQYGLALLPRPLLSTLLAAGAGEAAEPISDLAANPSPLTPRELQVLSAMADGASNKAIARRLGISYHTVKFHVAAILAKLDADTRTEAVARGAHLGLVML
jgi:DNA-binding NarL/FixJ family response regulator